MTRFSQRMGYTPLRSIMQVDSMDDNLKNSIWNVLHEYIFSKLRSGTMGFIEENFWYFVIKHFWEEFLKRPIHKMPIIESLLFKEIESYYFNAKWYEIYDMIEFFNLKLVEPHFPNALNLVFKRELSAYRFVNDELLKITTEEEIEEIEHAIKQESANHFASTHIKEGLKLLADRQNPDYRNSIKESISAVEGICVAIAQSNGGTATTLGAALKEIERANSIELHSALKQGFEKLYGYTSDDGIRHYLKSETEVNFEDAKFMLVSCSAFINYLTEKANKAGLRF